MTRSICSPAAAVLRACTFCRSPSSWRRLQPRYEKYSTSSRTRSRVGVDPRDNAIHHAVQHVGLRDSGLLDRQRVIAAFDRVEVGRDAPPREDLAQLIGAAKGITRSLHEQ